MKKIVKLLVAVLVTLLVFTPLVAMAMSAVGEVPVAYGKATIDGKIDTKEWTNSFIIDETNAKPWAGDLMEVTIKLYTLWDEAGLYVAGDIADPYVSMSDDGYNGDGFQLSLDCAQTFFDTEEARAIFYSLGCYEDGNSVLVRQEATNNGNLANGDEGVAIQSAKTEGGWSFEMLMPWTMLQKDVKEKANVDFTVAAGLKINGLVCYMDKDDTNALVTAFGTTLNKEDTAFDWGPKEHGITFILQAPVVVETTVAPVETEAVPVVPVVSVAEAPQTGDTMVLLLGMALLATTTVVLIAKKEKNTK